jgi:hypothetical protein
MLLSYIAFLSHDKIKNEPIITEKERIICFTSTYLIYLFSLVNPVGLSVAKLTIKNTFMPFCDIIENIIMDVSSVNNLRLLHPVTRITFSFAYVCVFFSMLRFPYLQIL